MGVPKVLENMLQVVSEENILLSWNIYQERDGTINFKLKFSGHEEPVNRVQQVSYKRKTTKQVQRDLERSRLWRSSRNQQTIETTPEPTLAPTMCDSSSPHAGHPQQSATAQSDMVGVKTRAMTRQEDPEIARSNEDEPETILNPDADSFTMPSYSTADSDVSQDSILLSPGVFNIETPQFCPHNTELLTSSTSEPKDSDDDEDPPLCPTVTTEPGASVREKLDAILAVLKT